MSRWAKLLQLMRTSRANVFTCPGRPVLTLQPIGGKAKPYQVRQVLDVIEQYGIEG